MAKTKRPTIFVQIPSYRDPECQWTIKDLFEKAKHPKQVFVGVCWQYDAELDQACFEIASPNPTNTSNLLFSVERSRGIGWARWQAQKLYDDEDYFLMIDSHMRFVEHWDSKMIAEFGRCESDKPFISCYPPSYTPPDNLYPNPKVSVLKSKAFTKRGNLRFRSSNIREGLDRPRPSAFLAGGYFFTKGSFAMEVPYDPRIYFNDDEICLSVRAYTHGWDGFAPSSVFIYHYYYAPKKDPPKHLHWKDHEDWRRYERLSRARREYLFCGTEPVDDPEALVEIEKYGLGGVRSVADYENFSGIDFKNQVVSEMALKGRNPKSIAGGFHKSKKRKRSRSRDPAPAE